jgi:hypothetical protein
LLSAKEAGEETEKDIAKKKAEILQRLISPEELPVPLRFFVAIVKDGIVVDVDYSDEVRNAIGEENLKQAINVAMQSSTGLSGEKLRAYNRRIEPIDKLFIDRIGFTFVDLLVKRNSIERILNGKTTDILPEEIETRTE